MSNLTATARTAAAAAIVLTSDDATAAALVATLKSAVNGGAKYGAYVAAHGVTRENVKHHATALAVLAYPNDEPIVTKVIDGTRTRTRFGNAVQAARAGMVKHLEPAATKPSDLLALLTKAATKAIDGGHTAEEITAALHAAGLTSVDATALAQAMPVPALAA